MGSKSLLPGPANIFVFGVKSAHFGSPPLWPEPGSAAVRILFGCEEMRNSATALGSRPFWPPMPAALAIGLTSIPTVSNRVILCHSARTSYRPARCRILFGCDILRHRTVPQGVQGRTVSRSPVIRTARRTLCALGISPGVDEATSRQLVVTKNQTPGGRPGLEQLPPPTRA